MVISVPQTQARLTERLSGPRMPVLLRLVGRSLPYKGAIALSFLVLGGAAALDVVRALPRRRGDRLWT